MEVTDAEDAADVDTPASGPKHTPHRYQLGGGPAASGLSRRMSSTRIGSVVARQTSSKHHSQRRTADDRRQASLRMASTSRADPAMAAAAAAALEEGNHSHKVANHILHHHNHHHAGTEHATITVSADGTSSPAAAAAQPAASGAGSADGSAKSSPFASAIGQSKTAAVVLGHDNGLAVAGTSKPAATSTAVVPANWPASGELGWWQCRGGGFCILCQEDLATLSHHLVVVPNTMLQQVTCALRTCPCATSLAAPWR